jgi:hypothetical protein
VAVVADSVPKRSAGNHAAAIFRAPTNVTLAPRPIRSRPPNSTAVVSAAAITRVPSPIRAPPAATTRGTPEASSRTPAGTIRPAYA